MERGTKINMGQTCCPVCGYNVAEHTSCAWHKCNSVLAYEEYANNGKGNKAIARAVNMLWQSDKNFATCARAILRYTWETRTSCGGEMYGEILAKLIAESGEEILLLARIEREEYFSYYRVISLPSGQLLGTGYGYVPDDLYRVAKDVIELN